MNSGKERTEEEKNELEFIESIATVLKDKNGKELFNGPKEYKKMKAEMEETP